MKNPAQLKIPVQQIRQVHHKATGLAHAGSVTEQMTRLLRNLLPEMRLAITTTNETHHAMEISLLFLFDCPTVRLESTMSHRSQVEMMDDSDAQKRANPALLTPEIMTCRLDHAVDSCKFWVPKLLQRVIAERLSSVELILFFKQAKLIALREVLNTKIAAPTI